MTVNELRDKLIRLSNWGFGDTEINVFLDKVGVFPIDFCGADAIGDVDIMCSSTKEYRDYIRGHED